jgi:hypothetical protein
MNWIRMFAAVLMLLGTVVLAVAQQQEGEEPSEPAAERRDRQGGSDEAGTGEAAANEAKQADGGADGENASADDGAQRDGSVSGEEQQQDGEGDQDGRPSAERVLQQLLQRRAENPLIEPARPDERGGDSRDGRMRRGEDRLSPGSGTLRREGEFIVQRRGRMVRAGKNPPVWMFVFEGGSGAQSDPPMLLMPCRHLEDMEAIVRDREASDSVEFVLSGRVFVYRGANYLLPTMVKRAQDRGNLNP